jgi:1,4-dihydroxy-2-naphthoate octaprenyltransferase
VTQELGNLISVTRANFLPLTVVIVFAGLAAAFYSNRVIYGFDALLVLMGSLLLHASVNAFNNYFDYRSRIDAGTTKTPFSGGIDAIVKGQMKPSSAFAVASGALLGAAVIGMYFLTRFFNALLPLMAYGAFVIVFYTPVLAKIHGVSEIVAGSGFGLMGLGTYVTQTGLMDARGVTVLVPVTILVALLLFLNEFPDADVDKAAGRRHLVILLGRRKAAWVYVGGLAATYASIILAVALGAAPLTVLLSLLTFPIAYKASRIVLKNYDRIPELVPAMGSNVLVILTTILLIGVGFSIAAIL